MGNRIMYAECEDDGFRVESADKDEIKSMLKTHVKNRHGMKVSDSDVEQKIIAY